MFLSVVVPLTPPAAAHGFLFLHILTSRLPLSYTDAILAGVRWHLTVAPY